MVVLISQNEERGEVAEWSNAAVSKTVACRKAGRRFKSFLLRQSSPKGFRVWLRLAWVGKTNAIKKRLAVILRSAQMKRVEILPACRQTGREAGSVLH